MRAWSILLWGCAVWLGCPSHGSAASQSYMVTVVPGYNAIANQLNNTCRLTDLLPNPPNGLILVKYSPNQSFPIYLYDADLGGWDPSEPSLCPGEGALVCNPQPASFIMTFTGEPRLPVLPLDLRADRFYLLSAQTNAPATFEQITGMAPRPGTALYRLIPGAAVCYSNAPSPGNGPYITHVFSNGVWNPSAPLVNVGESVFISGASNEYPNILRQPENLTAREGSNAVFTVTATGAAPLGYRWRFNGVTLPGATSSSLVLTGVQPWQVGQYSVSVSNAFGSVLSSNALLTVRGTNAGLYGVVKEVDRRGRTLLPIPGVSFELDGVPVATSDAQGNFGISDLQPGDHLLRLIKPGLYTHREMIHVVQGETRFALYRMRAQSGLGIPDEIDFKSPNGLYFLATLPGTVVMETLLAWNGDPGMVEFSIGNTRYMGTITNLGDGQATAKLTIPLPGPLFSCQEVVVHLNNANGGMTNTQPGVYFLNPPPIVPSWIGSLATWTVSGAQFSFKTNRMIPLIDRKFASDKFKLKAGIEYGMNGAFDAAAGTASFGFSGGGKVSLTATLKGVEVVGEGSAGVEGKLSVALAGCNRPIITPSWAVNVGGKAGIRVPLVVAVAPLVPPAAPVVQAAAETPVVGDIIYSLKLGLFFSVMGKLEGKYENLQTTNNCIYGATSVAGTVTFGVELEAVATLYGATARVYGGGKGTPRWDFCPEVAFRGVTLAAYVGVQATYRIFEFKREVGVQIDITPAAPMALGGLPAAPSLNDGAGWERLGSQYLRWGEMNRPSVASGQFQPASGSSGQTVVENTALLSTPSVVAAFGQTFILYALHDPLKPMSASTDIGVARRTGEGPWTFSRIADDNIAEFNPKVAAVAPNVLLAAWERTSGDFASVTNPADAAQHLEITASWFDVTGGTWTTPVQLTTNTLTDRDPLPVAFGGTQGILWVQNAAGATIGDTTNGDRLMFARWNGSAWDAPQMLWAAPEGLLNFSFVTNGVGAGHLVLASGANGDPDSRTNRELYALSTVSGMWQPPIRLTTDDVEDSLPSLAAPNGVPLCVWSADGVLTYSRLYPWNPRPINGQAAPAGHAPTLDAVTTPGGVATAWSVRTGDGTDIFASFYDANSDGWSLPRQLTHDADTESSLALSHDGTNLVAAFLKTEMVRTNIDVEINGEMVHLEDVPAPGRTDLCILRHSPGVDMAVVPASFVIDPPNPGPGSNAILRAIIENLGEQPGQGIAVAFYDGDPQAGGAIIGSAQMIAGPLLGGATQEVSVAWTVPFAPQPHHLFAVIDPSQTLADRERTNNSASLWTVLPNLVLQSCSHLEGGPSQVALVARVANTGVSPAAPVEISWRLGAEDGEEIARTNLPSLAIGEVREVMCAWDMTGRFWNDVFAPVHAVVDSSNLVREIDEKDNAFMQAVRVVARWVPELVQIDIPEPGQARLTFVASDSASTDFLVESAASLDQPVSWNPEPGALITQTAPGMFEARLALQGSQRFYRVGTAP